MPTNYVLIDFENVQPKQLAALDKDHFKIMLFVGARQAMLPYDVADAMHHMGTKLESIKISGKGPNALDFHIAFYIGKIASADPTASFHIVSNDKGFDPLIQHLKIKKISARRVKDISAMSGVQASSNSPEQRLKIVVARLRGFKAAKPRTVKTLKSTIASFFMKKISDAEVSAVVDALLSRGLVAIIGEKVTYALPADR